MTCQECDRLERRLLESLVFADRAQTAMRCFLLTHRSIGGVSDMDEYLALHAEERKTAEQRHQAILALVHHERDHGVVPAGSSEHRKTGMAVS